MEEKKINAIEETIETVEGTIEEAKELSVPYTFKELDKVTKHTKNGDTYTVNGFAVANTTASTVEKWNSWEEFTKKVDEALHGLKRSYIKTASLFYWFSESDIKGTLIDKTTGKPFTNDSKELEALTGLKATQINDMKNIFKKFFLNTKQIDGIEEGTEISKGLKASQFSQTQLVALLPLKDDEKKNVFKEIKPNMKVDDIKKVVGKYHKKNEARSQGAQRKVECKVIFKAVEDSMKDIGSCTDVKMIPQEDWLKLNEAYTNFSKCFSKIIKDIEAKAEENKKASESK